MSDSVQGVAWIDIAMLAALCISVLVGLLRGLVYEVMSLVGWVVAYIAATVLGPSVAHLLPIGTPGSGLNAAASYACVFIAVLLTWSVLSWLVKKLVQASPLNPMDRLLGGVFGVLRGVLLLLAVATVVMLTPVASSSAAWQRSVGAGVLGRVIAAAKPMLPPGLARYLRAPAGADSEEQGV